MKTDIILDAMDEINDEFLIISDKKRRRFSPKPLIIAATIALLFTITTPVLAAENEMVYNIMYALSPEIAQKMKPVRMQDENNGIVMEVISADVHDSEAEIYIGLTDIEGDRIDETADLFDSYSINRPFDSAATCKRISYDEQNKTATFLVHISQWNGEKIQGSKITFTVNEFLSGKQNIEALPLEIDENLLKSQAKVQKSVRFRGGGGIGIDIEEVKDIPCLVPFDTPITDFGGASLTAVGWHNGRLHIQMYYEDILNTDNHGSVHLKDADGNVINCAVNIAFWDKNKIGGYEEYIFDILQENVDDYKVFADLVLCNSLTEGPWQVTFPLEKE